MEHVQTKVLLIRLTMISVASYFLFIEFAHLMKKQENYAFVEPLFLIWTDAVASDI